MAARPFLSHTLVTASCWQAKLSEGLAHIVFVTTSSRRLGEEMGAAKLSLTKPREKDMMETQQRNDLCRIVPHVPPITQLVKGLT